MLVVAPKEHQFQSCRPFALMLSAFSVWFSYQLFWQYLHWKNPPLLQSLCFVIMHHLYIVLIYLSLFYYDIQFYIIEILQLYINRIYLLTEYKKGKLKFCPNLTYVEIWEPEMFCCIWMQEDIGVVWVLWEKVFHLGKQEGAELRS